MKQQIFQLFERYGIDLEKLFNNRVVRTRRTFNGLEQRFKNTCKTEFEIIYKPELTELRVNSSPDDSDLSVMHEFIDNYWNKLK